MTTARCVNYGQFACFQKKKSFISFAIKFKLCNLLCVFFIIYKQNNFNVITFFFLCKIFIFNVIFGSFVCEPKIRKILHDI